MNKTVVTGLVGMIVSLTVTGATAQFGRLSGRVLDQNDEPVPHANVVVVALSNGAMTTVEGGYSIRLPAGGWLIKVEVMGYTRTEQVVAVTVGDTTTVDFRVEKKPPKSEKVPLWKPAEPERMAREPAANIDSIAARTGIVSDVPRPPRPKRFGGLDFYTRHSIKKSGGASKVTVTAECVNPTSSDIELCGVFAFVERPRRRSLGIEGRVYDTPEMHCRGRILGPGESFQDSFEFLYDGQEPVTARIWVWFFWGRDGERWETVMPVDLGHVFVYLNRPSN